MTTTTEQELRELAAYKAHCDKLTQDIADEMAKPLRVNKQGRVVSGVFWIPGPMVEPPGGWPKPKRRKKPLPSQELVLIRWAQAVAAAWPVEAYDAQVSP